MQAPNLILLAAFGIKLIFPSIADRFTRPLVAIGGRLSRASDTERSSGALVGSSFILAIFALLMAATFGW